MLRSTTTLAILLLLIASPVLAQNPKEAASPPPPEGFSVSYAWVTTGLPGMAVSTTPVVRDIVVRPKLALDLPAPAPALSHLDFGAYEPYVPGLARRVLPDTPNDHDPFQLTLNGTATRTTVGTKVQAKAGNVAVRARATTVIPGVAAMGDRAARWRPAPDLKVDVRYAF